MREWAGKQPVREGRVTLEVDTVGRKRQCRADHRTRRQPDDRGRARTGDRGIQRAQPAARRGALHAGPRAARAPRCPRASDCRLRSDWSPWPACPTARSGRTMSTYWSRLPPAWKARRMDATPKVRTLIDLPAPPRRGVPFMVRASIAHPMEHGLRSDGYGNVVPRSIVTRFECRVGRGVGFRGRHVSGHRSESVFGVLAACRSTDRAELRMDRRQRLRASPRHAQSNRRDGLPVRRAARGWCWSHWRCRRLHKRRLAHATPVSTT